MIKKMGITGALVLLDQATKLIISHFFIRVQAVLIPGMLLFHPVQNKNLNWFASMANYDTSVLEMIVIQIISIACIVLFYRYFVFVWGKKHICLDGFLTFFAAGILCSFLDVVFWGGSLDSIRLFSWFTFDLKDVFLTVATIFLFLFMFAYLRWYSKLDEGAKNLQKDREHIWPWIKHGCPLV